MNKVNNPPSATRRCLVAAAGLALLSPVATPLSAPAQTETTEKGAGRRAVSVEVVRPARRTMVRELRMPATLLADEQVDLFSKVSGYIESIRVDIGSRVRQGDVLAKLSIPEMADSLRQAQAVLQARRAKVQALRAKTVQAQRMVETARAEVRQFAAQHDLDQINLDRQQELREGNAIPQQALDEALGAHAITEARLEIAQAKVGAAEAEKQAVEADVEVAEAEVLVSRADVAHLETLSSYASIKAPFDGIITVRHVDRGAFVRSAAQGATTPLLQIAKTDRIRVALEIPEIDAPYVNAGTKVEMVVKALGEHPFPATVARSAGALKPETRSMLVEVDLDNTANRFKPGMYAQVAVQLQAKEQALMIPSQAVRVDGKNVVVFVATDGVVQSRVVQLGYDDGIWAEITSGLQDDELIITSTSGAVVPGVSVSPVLSGS